MTANQLSIDGHTAALIQTVWDRLPKGHKVRHAIHHVFGPTGVATGGTVRMVADLFDAEGFTGEADCLRFDVLGDRCCVVMYLRNGGRHEHRFRAWEDAADLIRSLREDRIPFAQGYKGAN